MAGSKSSIKSSWLEDEFARIKDYKWLDYSSQIARRILAVLDDNEEINQKSLASSLDVSPQYVNKIVKGQENLTLETIAKLSDALGVELITFPDYKYNHIPETISYKGEFVSDSDSEIRQGSRADAAPSKSNTVIKHDPQETYAQAA